MSPTEPAGLLADLLAPSKQEGWCGACDAILGPFVDADAGQDALQDHVMTQHRIRAMKGPPFHVEVRDVGTPCRCRGGDASCAKCVSHRSRP